MSLEQEFSKIWRTFGVRNIALLQTPRLFDITRWTQPRHGIYHYVPFSHLDLGPDSNWAPVRNAPKPPYLHVVSQYTRMEGKPRSRQGINYPRIERLYLRDHECFRRVLKMEQAMLDAKTAMVFDYAKLHLGWKYIVNPMTRWHMFQNLFGTVFDTIGRIAKESERPQFVFIPMPDNLPARNTFSLAIEEASVFAQIFAGASDEMKIILDQDRDKAPVAVERSYEDVYGQVAPWLFEEEHDLVAAESFDELPLDMVDMGDFEVSSPLAMEAITTRTLKPLTDDRLLFTEELHRWLSPNRDSSIFSAIAPEHLSRVNLVFTEMGKFSIMNLGEVDKWRGDKSIEKEGLTYPMLAKRLESYYRSLMGLRSEADPLRVLSAIDTLPGEDPEPVVLSARGGSVADSPAMQKVEVEAPELKVSKPDVPMAKKDDAPEAKIVATQMPTDIDEDGTPETELPVITSPLTHRMDEETTELLRKGVISNGERRRFTRLSESYKTMKVGDETLEQLATIPDETVWNFKPRLIPDIPEVSDKGMLESTIDDFDRKYIDEVYHRDTARMVLAVQKGPIAVTGLQKERRVDKMGDSTQYAIRLTPSRGASTTWKFRLPNIDKNGKYRQNGVRYFARKFKTDKPVRKISGNEVALSSYYPNKIFVTRSEKKVDNWGEWLNAGILKHILGEGEFITNVVYGDNFHSGIAAPRAYTAIGQEYSSFTAAGLNWFFSFDRIKQNFPGYDGVLTPIAKTKSGQVIVIDDENHLHNVETKADMGPISNVLGIQGEAPIEAITMTVLDKDIPLGIALAHNYGMKRLMARIGAPLRRRPRGTRRDTTADEFEVVFADEVWVFARDHRWQTMVWQSFNLWHKTLRQTSVAELWKRDGYFMLFHGQGAGARHLTELENQMDYFIDPITQDILKEMKLPQEFNPLLERAASMLDSDNYMHELDTSGSLIRGYERFNGAVYREMVRGIRQFKNSRNPSRAGVAINPYAVITSIQTDPSISLVEDSNPVRNVKEKENVTASGVGGRSKRSMVRRHRAFHDSDVGIRSEANVDSGDTGINYYLTANPGITSLRGTVEGKDPSKATVTQLLSTPGNLAPFTTYDDGKRVSFVSIQQEHAIMAEGTRAAPLSTGYDVVLAHRTDPMFATAARQDGKVIAIGTEDMQVRYKDGSTETLALGRVFGTVTGHAVPHEIATTLAVGQGFKAGTNLAFNTGFFEVDYRNTTQVRWKSGVPAYVFVDESNDNFEDSSRISRRLANKLRTRTSHIRTVYLTFDKFPVDAVKVGSSVETDTVLMSISDDLSESVRSQSSGVRSMILDMGAAEPRAKYHGRVEHVECTYFGDKESMHPRLREFIQRFDSAMARKAKVFGDGHAKDCRITEPVRVAGTLMEPGMVALQYYITDHTSMGDGDKMVVANQLKTVIKGVIDGLYETVEEVFPGKGSLEGDTDFSYRAINARIVNSPILMGIGALCQEALGYEMADEFFK